MESLFPEKGSNPFPLQWQCRVLTTGLPGKSHKSFVFFNPFLSLFTLLGLVACLLGGSKGKESASIGDPGSISGSGRSPGEGNGNPLQYSCLENPMDGGAWQATVHGSQSRTRLSDFHFLHLAYLQDGIQLYERAGLCDRDAATVHSSSADLYEDAPVHLIVRSPAGTWGWIVSSWVLSGLSSPAALIPAHPSPGLHVQEV